MFDPRGRRPTRYRSPYGDQLVNAAPTYPARYDSTAAQQIKQQRRRYATAVLSSLARTQKGRPVAQVQQVLRDALRPLGVRLNPKSLHELAVNISTGQPVELP